MKVACWSTGHPIADAVAAAVYVGSTRSDCNAFPALDTRYHLDRVDDFDVHIGYGVLRGMDTVFKACRAKGKPFLCLDRGYWKPGHYDGFYRVSLNGTQQTSFDGLEPDYERWDALGIEVLSTDIEERYNLLSSYSLHCPPTQDVANFFGLSLPHWCQVHEINLIRTKGTDRPLQDDLDGCYQVRTFNSSVGWEALRQGIPVISDPQHSAVGAYQKKKLDIDLSTSLDKRREFFALLASLQLTLAEIRSGQLWPLVTSLINAGSVTMPESP